MAHITIVTTVYNRVSSVRLHLASLAQQTDRNFHLVIADDGSTEDIRGLCTEYAGRLNMNHYRQAHGDPLLGVRARNHGCDMAPLGTTHLWLTDGDIVFNPQAIAWAYQHIRERPDLVIAGRYDWMPAMKVTEQDLAERWEDFIECRLPRLATNVDGQGGGDLLPCGRKLDPRCKWPVWDDCVTTYDCKGGTLGSNLIVPIKAWEDTGGYAEDMPPACNAGDAEFGFALAKHGWRDIHCAHVIGYHLYHERDNLALTLGVRKGIQYICQKYGLAFEPKNLPSLPEGVTDEFTALGG